MEDFIIIMRHLKNDLQEKRSTMEKGENTRKIKQAIIKLEESILWLDNLE
jgi:uncharacterized UPF0160 family protein